MQRLKILLLFLALLVILSVACSIESAAASSRPEGARASPAEARDEAARLMDRVSTVARSRPGTGGGAPAWSHATAGEPLLIRDFEGKPASYLVPVADHGGTTVSTIGISAATGKWCWYTSCSQGKFPLVDAAEAAGRVKTYLRARGINAVLHAPQARMAPDKLVYWFFEIGGNLALKQVYLPVFLEDSPTSNLESKPWDKVRVFDPRTMPQIPIPAGQGVRPAATRSAGGAPPSYDIAGVPYHMQETSYYCGPASLEMLLGYRGPDIPQQEIAQVVGADNNHGSNLMDLVRAAQFSGWSTAVENRALAGYAQRALGFGAAYDCWANGTPLYDRRYSDLKELISHDHPVFIVTAYSSANSMGHCRVVKGYDDALDSFTVHDPWMNDGPDEHFEQSYLVDGLWPDSNRFGFIASPWDVSVSKPIEVAAGQEFTVSATVSYPGPSPLGGQYPCAPGSVTATFSSSHPYQMVGSPVTQTVGGISATGSSGVVSWRLRSLAAQTTEDISVVAQGAISGGSEEYPQYRDDVGGAGVGPAGPATTTRTWGHDSLGASEPATHWYLPEGSTAAGTETWILVLNPGDAPAHVRLTYMTPGGARDGPAETLPPGSRRTYNVAATVPESWSVSTEVTSDKPVVAERAMYGPGRRWGTDSIGSSTTSKEWYLPEGCTGGGFETWVLVQNPNRVAAKLSLTYMTARGEVRGPSVTVPADSRTEFNVGDTVPRNWEVSTKVTSDKPVVAERAVYWNNCKGAHDSLGITTPARQWYFAEGSTRGGFETWVLVANPEDTAAEVHLTYLTGEGKVAGPTLLLPAHGRRSVNVAATVPDTWSVSTRVTSDQPIAAERAVYWNDKIEGHDSTGVTRPELAWYLPEGCTGAGFETWVLVQNPNETAARVTLTYMTETGKVEKPSIVIPPNTRRTFNVAENVAGDFQVATVIKADIPVVAERAEYGDP